MPSTRVFEIGIVMAGAISAGAYSAGVMDFLMEALDAYEDTKRQDGWDGPVHDVRIPVLRFACFFISYDRILVTSEVRRQLSLRWY